MSFGNIFGMDADILKTLLSVRTWIAKTASSLPKANLEEKF
jgi:hypothetical protein